MAIAEHVELVKRGPNAIAEWRKYHPAVRLDLSFAQLVGVNLIWADLDGTNLCGANLMRAKLHNSDLSGADLSMANLMWAGLGGADLNGANLEKADLGGADFSRANLHGSNLRKADLGNTNFLEANLSAANLTGAYFATTILADVDLSSALGLNEVCHYGPSSIGVDTLYRSQGLIPEEFLRDCGVPEALIASIPSLIGAIEPIQWQSCFISHSTKDHEFALRLYDRMRGNNLRVWYAPENMEGGKKLMEQIERAIQVNDRLLLVLSDNSLKSEWVRTEIRKARKVERSESRRKLFPIRLVSYSRLEKWLCLDAETGEDLAAEVRSYYIPDFSNWKNEDAFEAAFERLLTDLKAASMVP